MKKHFLGIDIGTTGVKALLVDSTGKILATDTKSYPLSTPQAGWSEQNPDDWWEATVRGIRSVVKKSKISPDSICGIGLSGQMHGAVLIDKNGKVLRPAILWNDQRTFKECEEIEKSAGGQKKLIKLVANPALTGFTAPKILWVRKNEPSIYRKIKKILLPKDYIRFKLTGVVATDLSDASGTLLLDVVNRRWNKSLLKKLRIDEDLLPPCYESPEITGFITARSAKLIGLPEGIPVIAGAGDQPAAAIGAGIVKKGILSATIGTSGVVFAYTDTPTYDPEGRVHTMCHSVPGKWCIFGCMLSAGGSLRWFRDTLGQPEKEKSKQKNIDPYDLLMKNAQKSSPTANGVIFLPYLTGERTPHKDPFARGVFFGLSLSTDRNDLIRAVVEGITFGMKDQIDIMRKLGITPREIRLLGGGAKSQFWCKLQADIYNTKVSIPKITEGSAFGAAILAMVGTNTYSSVKEACRKLIKTTKTYSPTPKTIQIYQSQHKLYNLIYSNLKSTFVLSHGSETHKH